MRPSSLHSLERSSGYFGLSTSSMSNSGSSCSSWVEHFFHVEFGLVLLFLAEIDEKGMGERLKIGNILFVGIFGIEAVAQKAAFFCKQPKLFAVVFRLLVPFLFDAFPFRNGAHERFGDLPALPFENGEAGTETAVVLTDLFGNFTLAL